MTNIENKLNKLAINLFLAAALSILFIGSACAQVQPADAGDDQKADLSDLMEYELTGTWIVTIDGGPAGFFKGLHTYSAGGAMIETNQTDMQPPKQTTGQGTWVKTGRNRYGFTFVSFQYDDKGVAVGALKVRSKLRLLRRNSFVGESEVLICDANVENCFSVGGGVDSAVRMEVESPESWRKDQEK